MYSGPCIIISLNIYPPLLYHCVNLNNGSAMAILCAVHIGFAELMVGAPS
jgi:hypothetical protein